MRLTIILLWAALAFSGSVRFSLVSRETLLDRLHSCPSKDMDREQQIRTYFAQAGCSGSSLTLDQPKHSKYGNVVCTLEATSPETIVVGAHFDHVDVGSGAVDNWSGASLLPSLYEAIAKSPRKHTYVFVAFYGEEQGMVGSKQYVHDIGKEKLAHIVAMVNMDTLGL